MPLMSLELVHPKHPLYKKKLNPKRQLRGQISLSRRHGPPLQHGRLIQVCQIVCMKRTC
jgi:hypothetical protein